MGIVMKNKEAFTLVELLVVISIIALLSSILLPSLKKARNLAKATVCKANLRQWGIIFMMYTEDNNGYFWPGYYEGSKSTEMWTDALRPYYKGGIDKLRCCPKATKKTCNGDAGKRFEAWGITDGTWLTAGDYGSYGVNSWLSNPPSRITNIGFNQTKDHWRRAFVKGAKDVPMFLDAKWIDSWPKHTDFPPSEENMEYTASNMTTFFIDRHDGHINSVFLDCSSKKVGLKELYKLKWNKSFDQNGPWTKNGVMADRWPEWTRSFKDY